MPDKLSFILYQNRQAPRYVELSRWSFKFLFVVLPSLALFGIVVVTGVLIYFKQLEQAATSHEPKIIKELQQEKLELEDQLSRARELSEKLQDKLASSAPPTSEGVAGLGLFKATPGMEDLSSSPIYAVDQLEAFIDENKLVRLRFHIVNLASDGHRQSGYVFVLMKGKTGFFIHPKEALESEGPLLNFLQGESFATSRFRPVDAVFPAIDRDEEILFKILIFSRTGDLVHKQTITKQVRI